MNSVKKTGLIAAGGLSALMGLGWLGLRMPPKPADIKRHHGNPPKFAPLPNHFPPPVRRHYEMSVGHQMPLIETAVITGRAYFRMGLWMRMRFAAYHVLGQHYLRDMEVTWFNIPFLKGQDSYINGKGKMDINGKVAEGYSFDQAANLMTWSEAVLFPASFVHTSARWEPINDTSAKLIIPFGEEEDSAIISFDPTTGFMRRFSAMRYKGDDDHKTPWDVEYHHWKSYGALRFPSEASVTWADEGSPYFVAHIDQVSLSADMPDALPKPETDQGSWRDMLAEQTRETAVSAG